MSNAWEYKEDDWQEHADLEWTINENSRKDHNVWTLKKLKEEIQKENELPENKRNGRYYHVVPDSGDDTFVIISLGFSRRRSFGFSVDKEGYPIENSEQLHKDFPKPPVDFADAQKQVEKLNRDLYMDFPTWLGHHSREGWEIFKISRDFRDGSQAKRTWCVFRRKI